VLPPITKHYLPCPKTRRANGTDQSFTYHLRTIYLFTASDFKTIALPKTFIGLANALSGPHLLSNPSQPFPIIIRLPLVFLWVWLHLLVFAVSNQRNPASITEDAHNKPFRPLPAGRITQVQAGRLLLVLHPFVFGMTLCVGGARQGLLIMGLTFAYNGLGGGEHFLAKNLINAAAYVAFASGATAVAHGTPVWNAVATKWGGIIGSCAVHRANDGHGRPGWRWS
jgi:UbiA prenyltransferase family